MYNPFFFIFPYFSTSCNNGHSLISNQQVYAYGNLKDQCNVQKTSNINATTFINSIISLFL
uniref:Uncharacterized protein n=1 Tax=Megaselia scalaris TaxID=36166 RepID=T1H1Y3_MEGSC